MEIALLVVGILTLGVAAAAAWFAFPAYRDVQRRPDLVLQVIPGSTYLDQPGHEIGFQLRIENQGRGDAVGWKVILESTGLWIRGDAVPPGSALRHVLPGNIMRVEWEGQAIGSGLVLGGYCDAPPHRWIQSPQRPAGFSSTPSECALNDGRSK